MKFGIVAYGLMALAGASPARAEYSFAEAQGLLRRYCAGCHQGASPAGGFDVTPLRAPRSIGDRAQSWSALLARVKAGEMPPKPVPKPAPKERKAFVAWLDGALRGSGCPDEIAPGPAPVRRLNRTEYSATLRDLLNIHINAGRSLPADGAGGEGFDNAAETLFLSPIHAEKYLEAARQALEYGAADPKSRARFMAAQPGADRSAEPAARKNLEAFLPRAFRRPAAPGEVDRYLALFRAAEARGDSFSDAMLFALRGILISPNFLFRVEQPGAVPGVRLVPDYALAARLSYFLWGSMPDDALFELAAQGKLQDPAILNEQIARMLKDLKSRDFAESFVEQWLGTRELGRDIKPDRALFPAYYDAELQAAIRYEPILFFQEVLSADLPLLNLIDSKFTYLTNKLQRHYNLSGAKLRQQPVHVDLPEGSHRGGVVTMAAVLAVSSYPQRTSPVLRGKWILESLLGTPPPPPPPDVPPLGERREGDAPKTMRERLSRHRAEPACASCHSRIDPLGFALENYDVLGRWRDEESGRAVDAAGELPGGVRFEGVDGLKAVLLDRKELFLKNLTAKMLGYALGRGLTVDDHCVVDRIVERLAKEEYRAHALVREIVFSAPFRYRQDALASRPVGDNKR